MDPVWETLINFLNMKRGNPLEIEQASKHVLIPTLCYNQKNSERSSQNNRNHGNGAIHAFNELKYLEMCFYNEFEVLLILN